MITKSNNRALVAGFLLCAAGITTAQAASSIVTFSVDMATNIANGTFTNGVTVVNVNGTFNSWAALPLVEVGSSTVYTNTANDTTDTNGGVISYKFTINGSYEGTADFNNRAARLPSVSGASLVLPTPFYGDSGAPVTNNVTFQVDMSQQINLNNFTNGGGQIVEVRGNFNSWTGGANLLTNDPSILRTNQFGLVTSNVYTGVVSVGASPNAAMDYKFVFDPPTNSYEGVSPANADAGGNRFFMNSGNQTLPVADYSDAPFAPLSSVTFSVDMSAQSFYSNWNSSMPIALAGSFNNWNTGTPYMTNNPSSTNTNIYYETIVVGQGATEQYKFTFQGTGGTVWENPSPPTLGGNRFFTVPTAASTTLPTVFFSDLQVNDLLTKDMMVTFTIDMTTASQYPSGPAFNPSTDTVYVNGSWLGWLGWNPINLAPYQLTNTPPGSEIYTGQFTIPKGSPIPVIYKYSINGTDDEAASGNNHQRYVRSTATGAYSFPVDTFGNQYGEPSFGQLAIGRASAGTVPLSWLGAPNVQVQTSPSLAGGSWVSHPETAGTVWTTGTSSSNGLVSLTNWPTGGGSMFFRLIQQ
jgi:hypothetical protein